VEETLQLLAFTLIATGLLLTALGAVLESFHRLRNTARTRFGGFVLVGPIPIVVGSDSKTVRNLVYLGLALTAALVALTLLLNFLAVA